MVLRRVTSITRGIGRDGPWKSRHFVRPFDSWEMNVLVSLRSFDDWKTNNLVCFRSFDSLGTNKFGILRLFESWGTNALVFFRSFDGWGTNTLVCRRSFDSLGTNNSFFFVPSLVEVQIYSFFFASIQGTNSAGQCRMTGQYNNPVPTWFLVPICRLFKNTSTVLEL